MVPHSSVAKPGSLHYPTEADWRATPLSKSGEVRGGGRVSIPYRAAKDLAGYLRSRAAGMYTSSGFPAVSEGNGIG
jgi:hypothetical protein